MKFIRLDEVNSTNSYAKSHVDDIEDMTVIHAMRQTDGRGRLRRSWVDLGEGNLFMSFVLKPSDKFSEIYPNLTQYLSVCLCEILEKFYGLQSQIKWPNDVLIDGKKIAGILSETVISSDKLKGIILGIGVNLNANQQDIDNIPNKIATALNLEISKLVDVDLFRTRLVDRFFENYDKFLNSGFKMIADEYIKRNCFIGKELNVQIFDKIESGLAESVNDNGELVLKKEDKQLVLTIGDIL